MRRKFSRLELRQKSITSQMLLMRFDEDTRKNERLIDIDEHGEIVGYQAVHTDIYHNAYDAIDLDAIRSLAQERLPSSAI